MIDAYTIRRKHLASVIEDARGSVRFAIETCERLLADLNPPEPPRAERLQFREGDGPGPDPDYEALGYVETRVISGKPDSAFITWLFTDDE